MTHIAEVLTENQVNESKGLWSSLNFKQLLDYNTKDFLDSIRRIRAPEERTRGITTMNVDDEGVPIQAPRQQQASDENPQLRLRPSEGSSTSMERRGMDLEDVDNEVGTYIIDIYAQPFRFVLLC